MAEQDKPSHPDDHQNPATSEPGFASVIKDEADSSRDTTKGQAIGRLLSIMAALRQPDSGCPWDIGQSWRSILPYTIEEVYEVADAIEREDYDNLKDELGDLLFQVVFYARIGEEEGRFNFDDITEAISDKLERRHPHVFAGSKIQSEDELHLAWEKQKQKERQQKKLQQVADGSDSDQPAQASLMDDIPVILPELKKAQKIQKRAAKHGFDWDSSEPVFAKVAEEIEEIRAAVSTQIQSEVAEEVGDLLFAVVNLARHLKVDADSALRGANHKFMRRFREIERLAGYQVDHYSLEQLEAFWQLAKKSEK